MAELLSLLLYVEYKQSYGVPEIATRTDVITLIQQYSTGEPAGL